MSTTFAITTLIELAVAGLLIYGFMNEDKVIAFEQTIKRIVLGNTRRLIRKSKERKERLNGGFSKWINIKLENKKQETRRLNGN